MKWHIYVDGASSGNPGDSGAGMVAFNEDGVELMRDSKYLGRMTNNMAEYEALLNALEKARENGAEHVAVYTDSQLVANQVRGEYKVRDEKLRPYVEKVLHSGRFFKSFSIEYIPRESNNIADKLAKAGANKKG
jgi:ribonuclease HI